MLALRCPRSYNRRLHIFIGTMMGSMESVVVECTDVRADLSAGKRSVQRRAPGQRVKRLIEF
jgi:hypothetical protein